MLNVNLHFVDKMLLNKLIIKPITSQQAKLISSPLRGRQLSKHVVLIYKHFKKWK